MITLALEQEKSEHPLAQDLTEIYKKLFGDNVKLSMSARLPMQSGITVKSKPTVGLYSADVVEEVIKSIDELVPGNDHASVDLRDFLIAQVKYATAFVQYINEITMWDSSHGEVANVIKEIVLHWTDKGINEKLHNLPRVIGIVEGLYKERIEPRHTRHFYQSRIQPCGLSDDTVELITSTYEKVIGDPFVKL